MVSGDLGLQAPEKGRGKGLLHHANFVFLTSWLQNLGQFCSTQQGSSGAVQMAELHNGLGTRLNQCSSYRSDTPLSVILFMHTTLVISSNLQ